MDVSPTFRTYAQKWYYEAIAGVCYVQSRSLQNAINNLNLFIGNKLIGDVKPADITNIITSLARKNPHTGKPTSKRTLQHIVKTAFRIFDAAIDDDLIVKNPAKNKMRSIPKTAPTKKVTSITKEHQELIRTTPHRCQLAALIMMYMGLRRGEVIALEWSDFNFDDKTVHVCKHAVQIDTNEFQVFPGTKNGKERYIPVPDHMIDFLYKTYIKAPTSLVFTQHDGTLHTPSSFASAWRSYNNELNFKYSTKGNAEISKFDPKGFLKSFKINAHELRHTYATLLYLSGVDISTASKLMGHSTVQLTLDIYTHLDSVYKQPNIEKFNAYLSDCNICGYGDCDKGSVDDTYENN